LGNCGSDLYSAVDSIERVAYLAIVERLN
jgi:hypothetical protein